MRDFEQILAPISLEAFAAEYYEERPLFVSRNLPHYYDDLVTIEEIDRYLAVAEIPSGDIRLVRSGDELDPQTFATDEGNVDKEKIFQKFNEGYAIIIYSHDRHSEGMSRLRRLVEGACHAYARPNIFLSPPHSQGFGPHWDNHDSFILQFEGSKEWTFYDRRDPLPTAADIFNGEWLPVPPTRKVTLSAGDLLYVPNGYVHEVRSTDSVSGHVTLGFSVHTYADLLRSMIEEIDRAPEFRDSLPFAFGDVGVDPAPFRDRIAAFFARADVAAGVRRLYEKYLSTRRPDA